MDSVVDKKKIDLCYEDVLFALKLFETQSLTLTAQAFGFSMGAASRRLAHVREVFGDELFVRSGLTMLPTNRMKDLRPQLIDLVCRTKALFSADRFDLKSTARNVRIVAADNAVATFMNGVIGRFYEAAPLSRLTILPLDLHLYDRIRDGEADMAFFPLAGIPADFHELVLYKTRKGLMVRHDHPLAKVYDQNGRLTVEDVQPWGAVKLEFGGRPAKAVGINEIEQPTGMTVPYVLSVPYVVSQTDFTFSAPLMTLQRFTKDTQFKFRILPMPEAHSHFTPRIVWHHSTHTDPFLQWVRGLIADAARSEAKALGFLEGASF